MSTWQPIATAPMKIHERVLLWWTTRGACSGYFDVDEDRNTSGWRGDQDLVIPRDQKKCTHWMPLPDQPVVGSHADQVLSEAGAPATSEAPK